MAVVIRRLAYSPARGVFMRISEDGQPVWSTDHDVHGDDTAMTFADRPHWDRFVQEKQFLAPADVELREVHPHGEGLHATADDAANALLTRWDI